MEDRIAKLNKLLNKMEAFVKEQEPMMDVETAMDNALVGKPLSDTPDPRMRRIVALREKYQELTLDSQELMVKKVEEDVRNLHSDLIGTRQPAPVGRSAMYSVPATTPGAQVVAKTSPPSSRRECSLM